MSADTVSAGPLWAAMYHSITDSAADPYQVTVSPARLDRQLRWMRRHGLTGVSMERLLLARARGSAAGLVGLTFDDGYVDFLTNAVPLLRRYEFTATVYVLPGRLGGTNEWDRPGPSKPLLTEDGIREAAAAGMEVGSHGLRHTDLTEADDALLREETRGSREALNAITGGEVTGFCYPYGTVDERAMTAVREAGYRYAVGISPGPLTGLFALPRVHIGQEDTAPRLFLKRALHGRRREPVPYAAYAPYVDTPAVEAAAQEGSAS
ncbi:polysaccharide deacetylase family protein [Streptomyces sp. NPDC050433]|uniref:polysaccharide deacetylase family protein n=1 Tax=Streptomyces sp. NPDC050433 TaxID=3365615 RepID=UPI0037ACAF73